MNRPGRSDDGSVAVSLVVVGLVALLPVVYVVHCLLLLHSAALASTQAGREAARAFSAASTVPQARRRALMAARLAFADQGFDLPSHAIRLTCLDGACLSPGSAVVVDVDWRVRLPLLPAEWEEAAVRVSSTHRVPIDEFRSSS